MKELSTEQKAKRYDELLVKLQEAKVDNNVCDERYCCVIDDIVPELKENEDERIRKWLIRTLKSLNSSSVQIDGAYEMMLPAIAYLEKQGEQKPMTIQIGKSYKCIGSPRYTCFRTGDVYKPCDEFICSLMNLCSDCFEPIEDGEQKPADKVEPKFKVGDIVKHKDNPHLTYILKRFTDDGDYEFHAIGKDGHEGCTCFSVVKYQDEWELVEQKTVEN